MNHGDPKRMSPSRIDNPENSNSQRFPQRPFGPRFDRRFRRQVEAIHGLGPYAFSCLLEEIAAGADWRATVATYAAFDGGLIAEFGGHFPTELLVFGGDAA